MPELTWPIWVALIIMMPFWVPILLGIIGVVIVIALICIGIPIAFAWSLLDKYKRKV